MERILKRYPRGLAALLMALVTAGVAVAQQATTVGTLEGHTDPVYAIAWSPDGKTLATAGWDEIIRFWETDTGNIRREVKVADRVKGEVKVANNAQGDDLRMYAVCYAPEGEVIATAHLDGTVRIWQADEMLLRTQFQVNGSMHSGPSVFRRMGFGWPRARHGMAVSRCGIPRLPRTSGTAAVIRARFTRSASVATSELS